MASNRTLGERVHDALVTAAERKAEAMRLRRMAERYFDIALLKATGRNADERRASARQDPNYEAADTKAVEAECAAIVAKAEADGLQIEFYEWQSREATAREEMKLR